MGDSQYLVNFLKEFLRVTPESYKRFLKLFFIVFIPITLLADFGEYLNFIDIRAFWFVILYANSILALILLYFGIYAHVFGVKKEPKSDGPVVYIMLGCLLVLLSFGRPLFASYMVHRVEKDIAPIMSSENLARGKSAALDISVLPSSRLIFATQYYLVTGESIEYIDAANDKKLYMPDKVTKERYEKMDQRHKESKRINQFIRINGLAHGSILLLSIPIFLLIVRHKKKILQGNIH
jgi:hypothetical protein